MSERMSLLCEWTLNCKEPKAEDPSPASLGSYLINLKAIEVQRGTLKQEDTKEHLKLGKWQLWSFAWELTLVPLDVGKTPGICFELPVALTCSHSWIHKENLIRIVYKGHSPQVFCETLQSTRVKYMFCGISHYPTQKPCSSRCFCWDCISLDYSCWLNLTAAQAGLKFRMLLP